MSSSQLAGPEADSIAKSRKRRNPRPPPLPSPSQSRKPFVRPRKKRKRLDAIRDRVLEPVQAPAEAPEPADTDALRRSSRVRRPKIVTNSSSSHSPDRKRKRRFNRSTAKTNRNDEVRFDASKGDRRVRHSSVGDLEETGDWGVRLRSRARNLTVSPQKVKGRNKTMEALAVCEEEPKLLKLKKTSKVKVSDKSGDQIILSSIQKEESNQITMNESLSDSSNKAPSPVNNSVPDIGEEEQIIAVDLEPMMPTSIVEVEAAEGNGQCGQPENGNCIVAVGNNAEDDRPAGEGFLQDAKNKKSDEVNSVINDASIVRPRIKEGRRCGLCGGGTDGKPPKKLARDCGDSDNEVYGGSSASEDPNYDSWDGFDDEPDWLGPLLGPIHDRFGIAGVWVHRHCAVWSPEVYFADLGCLKNVRAALCRGRALKCSRCGRPGATIGCRVDRCPKTYHLPCARAEHSIFDHRKFLIACADHRHLFQPHGYHYLRRIKRLKAKKMRWEFRKLSHDASRKDLEAEEMWLENCGEDEEFLKREGRRLHRDLLRIKPVYIGGDSSCKSDDLYQGFESVAGLQGVIQCMKEVVILPLLYPEFFSSIGLTPPRGVLLHGYPGTGKTLVVRALIGACSRGDKRIAYFARKGADCLGKYVGDAERQLRLLFQVAEKSQPSIIFFDEIDGLAPCRSKQQDQTHSSVVSTLLALLDGLKSRGSVIVIGATNRPDAVDPALRRPGRFDREIYFPLPSVKDRSAILSLHTQRWPKPVSGSFLSWIAEQTAGFAGADLQALCTQAAMIALKRNCALQELLSAAERHPSHGRRLSLPSFVVEEQDWLAALACAPPPCSRREAGSCANDVVSSPLHSHLTPCLMHPITHLLISLYLDERISLPPHIYKIAKLMKDLIYSALEQKKLPFASWITHLHHLIQESCFAKDVERKLAQSGLLTGASVFPNSESSDHGNDDHENSDSRFCGYGSTGALMGRGMMNFFSGSSGATSGFRVLIAGSPRCGQRHVAACLLHGFVGHIEVQKVNLATISQEGRGDMVQGITHILLKCFSVGRCIIYMPRIDLWAMDKTHDEAAWKEEKLSTEAWNSFIEQVDSMSASASFIILATCETPNSFLPHRISQFFTSNVSNFTGPSPPEHTIPRFLMQLDGKFNRELVFDLSAENIARDLIKQYVQLVHCRTHVADKFKIRETMKGNSEGKTLEMDSGTANGVTDGSSVLKSGGTLDEEVGTRSHQDSVARIPPKRNAKGKSNLLYSIATFGYQILRYPHFAELCWATSKLKDGPCTGVNGPWKAWPFNSCFIFPNNLMEKKAIGGRNRENSVVRGLVAVGLLAYKGFYTSVREVSLEVRRVLELFVEHINTKILGGKDRYQFLRLLSQVAYLEDMVNSWAYSLQSLELECQVSSSNWRPTNVGRLDSIDNHAYSGGTVKNDEILPTISDDNKKEAISLVSEENLVRVSPEKVGSGKSNKEDAHLGLNDLDEAILSPKVDGVISGLQVDAFQDMVSLPPTSNALFKNGGNGNANKEVSCPDMSASGRGVLGPGIEIYQEMVPVPFSCPPLLQKLELASGSFCIEHPPCSSENHGSHNGGLGSPILSNGSVVVESKGNCHSVRNTVSPLEENGCNANKPIGDSNPNFTPDNNDTSISETLCVYSCCCECMYKIRGLVREIIRGNWESNGCGSTVEDVHDVVETCSVSLLATIKKSVVSKSCTNSGDLGGTHDKHCCCQKVGDTHLKKISLSEGSENIGVMPMECICHSSTRNSRSGGPRLRFFYRDCRLVSSDPDKEASFHCKFESLCACATIEKILMIREPLD